MKRVIAAALCAGLLLSGCQGSGQQTAAESEQSTKTANQESALMILSQYDNFDPNDPSSPEAEPGRVLAEATGTKVQYSMLPAENTNEKLYLEISGGAKYNLVKLRKPQYDVLVSQGALLDMRPYLEEYAPDLMKEGVIGDEFWQSVTGPNGELYGVPQKNDSNHITYNLAYRKDILEQYGLPVPKTTQEFYDVVKALADNGIKSPLVSVYPITNGISGAFGIPNTWDDVDGQLVYKGMNPGFFEYADYMKSLYEAGGMGKEPFGTITNKDTFPRFASGEAVFMMASWWNTTAFVNDMKALGIENPEEKIGWIQSLTGPDGKKGVFRDKGINYVASIPKYMEETAPEVCKYLNQLVKEDIVTQYVLGEENKDFEVKDGKYIPIAGSDRQGGRPDWYVLGIPDALWEKYWPATLYNLPEQYRAWETIQKGAEEFGVFDIMQMAPPLEKWGQAKMVLDAAAMLAASGYFIGKETGVTEYEIIVSPYYETYGKKLCSAILENKYEEACTILDETVELVKAENLAIFFIVRLWNQITILLHENLHNASRIHIEYLDFFQITRKFDNVDELGQYLKIEIAEILMSQKDQLESQRNVNENFMKLLKYVDSHYSEKLNLNSLSETFFLNMSYCSELFKKVTKLTFSDYLTKIRMERAAALLSEGGYLTREVAEMTGYSDPFYFSKVFKKYYGVTPAYFLQGHMDEGER